MPLNDRAGLRPARHLGGGQIRTQLMQITASGNAAGIFVGDVVALNGGGLGIIKVSGDNNVATTLPVGVVTNLYDENNRPLTFSQPTRGPFLPGSTAGFADVVTDPMVTFVVQADASSSPDDIGKYAWVSAPVGGFTAAGTSNMQLQIASVDTSIKPLKIIGISPIEGDRLGLSSPIGIGAGGTNQDLEVLFVRHFYRT
jgi:hypothetical protein